MFGSNSIPEKIPLFGSQIFALPQTPAFDNSALLWLQYLTNTTWRLCSETWLKMVSAHEGRFHGRSGVCVQLLTSEQCKSGHHTEIFCAPVLETCFCQLSSHPQMATQTSRQVLQLVFVRENNFTRLPIWVRKPCYFFNF